MTGKTQIISDLIKELTDYGAKNALIEEDDRIFCINRLLELFEEDAYEPGDSAHEVRDLHLILEDMIGIALEKGILASDTTAQRDLFDTKIMGLITPAPSVVRKRFSEDYRISPKEATDRYYELSKASNYIRCAGHRGSGQSEVHFLSQVPALRGKRGLRRNADASCETEPPHNPDKPLRAAILSAVQPLCLLQRALHRIQ